jgi:hypothetical protein
MGCSKCGGKTAVQGDGVRKSTSETSGTGWGCSEETPALTVDESQVIWRRAYANMFGIKSGDDLNCIVEKIWRHFNEQSKKLTEEVAQLRKQLTINN